MGESELRGDVRRDEAVGSRECAITHRNNYQSSLEARVVELLDAAVHQSNMARGIEPAVAAMSPSAL
jgi:hypothetical protein